MTDKEFIESAPTLDQLKSQANTLYKAAEDAGVTFPADDYTRMIDRVSTMVKKEGIDPVLHPKTHRTSTRS